MLQLYLIEISLNKPLVNALSFDGLELRIAETDAKPPRVLSDKAEPPLRYLLC
jgi:hypothetical protein